MSRSTCLAYVRKSMVRKGVPDPAAPDIQRGRIAAKLGDAYAVEWYEDAEGHSSGLTDERPAWQRLLGRLADPDVAAVAVESWEKAARNVKHLLQLVDECDRLSVRFVSAGDNIDTTTADGRFQLTILTAVAEHYARRTGERRAASIDYLRRQKGRHYGLAPFGTRRVERAGDLVLTPSDLRQANGTDHDALRVLYELYVTERMGMRYVAERLNDSGWRCRDRAGRLRPWNRDDVRRALASHWLYAGYVTVGRAHRDRVEILPGSHEPILPETLLAPVALRLEQSHKPGARIRQPFLYPLSAVLRCACGAPLKGIFADDARRYRHLLRCRDGHRYQHRADDLERAVREHVAGLPIPAAVQAAAGAETLRHLAEQQGGGQAAERERLQLAIDRLAELYADGQITRAQYDQKRAAYEVQMPAGMSMDMPAPGPADGLPPLALAVQAASPGMLREMVSALYEAVVVEPDGGLTYRAREWCQGWAG